jgi:predicted lipid-binding transport protein (Tim44 family)
MLNKLCHFGGFPLVIFMLALFFIAADSCHEVDARARRGGRSFGSSRTYRPRPSTSRTTRPRTVNPSRSGGFMRSMAGGLAGGFLGSMLFGGMRGGGFGGSGIGLFEILIIGGIIYFLYKKFSRPRNTVDPGFNSFEQNSDFTSGFGGPPPPPMNPLQAALKEIGENDPEFDPEHFKEVAQDVFFKIQAGWTRRDFSLIKDLLGDNLAREYEGHFAEMTQKGQFNRLENIAVRKVEIVEAGVDQNEEFITILFTANLLDYTVDEASGSVLSGDPINPVKFKEKWTFARPRGSADWKLEGISE